MLTPLVIAFLTAAGVGPISGTVFVDQNGNGRRDPGERGLGGVVVSDQVEVARTAPDGSFSIADSRGFGLVFVSVPSGYRSIGPFWRRVAAGPAEFALAVAPAPVRFSFVHASDTHISPESRPRTVQLRAAVDSLRPAFVLITGDLVRDALRVPEAEATGYYDLFQAEAGRFSVPLWTVPGNHEIFGIERLKSGVSADHPLYGRAMYRHYRGPDYYSFNYGGIHFVGLNSIDIDDMAYYGHVDSVQAAWLAADLAAVPATTPVVTFNHIPFFTAVETINGFMDGPPAATPVTVNGKTSFRHAVSNAGAIIAQIAPHPFPVALGGHMHTPEQLRYVGIATRFNQAAAVVGPAGGSGLSFPSGVTVYRVDRGRIDEGTFVPLPPRP